MAIGLAEPPDEPEEPPVEWVDWAELYTRESGDEPIIPGLAYRGRWTAIASPAKAGKSTVVLGLVIEAARAGFKVAFLDAEMGRADMLDRVEEWMQLKPDDLVNVHYTDLPPKLDNIQGASRFGAAVELLQPDLVIIDGINGVVNGAENDDTTWRDLYEWTIAPLKALNIAIITADNTGHADKNRPRGSSVKLDKADAVIALERTNSGVKLTATLRRTAAYPLEQHYDVAHASEEGPPMTVTPVGGSLPEGVDKAVAILDRLNAPEDITVRAAARLIREHGEGIRQDTVRAAVKLRHNRVTALWVTPNETPASGVCPDAVSHKDTPPSEDIF